MKIRYTKHAALEKLAILEQHNFVVTRRQIREIIFRPDHQEPGKHPFQFIASKQVDERHILRVVYRKDDDIIIVITFYPAEIGRYY